MTISQYPAPWRTEHYQAARNSWFTRILSANGKEVASGLDYRKSDDPGESPIATWIVKKFNEENDLE